MINLNKLVGFNFKAQIPKILWKSKIPKTWKKSKLKRIPKIHFGQLIQTTTDLLDLQGFQKFQIEKKDPKFLEPLKIQKIRCGLYQSYFLSSKSDLWACDTTQSGELGIKFSKPRVKKPKLILQVPKVSKIWCDSEAQGFGLLTHSGQFMVAGNSVYGQLGLNNRKSTNYLTPVKLFETKKILKVRMSRKHSLVLVQKSNTKTSLYTTGFYFVNGLDSQISSWTRLDFFDDFQISCISVGLEHSWIKTSESKFFAWGWNDYNQIRSNRSKFKNIQKPTEIKFKNSEIHELIPICGSNNTFFNHPKPSKKFRLDLCKLKVKLKNEFCSLKINSFWINQFWFEFRLNQKSNNFLKKLLEKTKEIEQFLEFLISDQSFDPKNFQSICENYEIENLKDVKFFKKDLFELLKDKNSKDFRIRFLTRLKKIKKRKIRNF
jgi:hypothetical protein